MILSLFSLAAVALSAAASVAVIALGRYAKRLHDGKLRKTGEKKR